ncbi:hypothetical protein [Nocardioides sp. Soil774]|uniref:hypothetical protein n=1 Tax=Nocardioides sp. Soil774 TaxID=1736408 RepID=UPI0012FCC28A|nr:hypothetical protein [Nocardioides sp. Soil774]
MNLDEIDWSAVQGAYGPATSVPTLLHQLASSSPGERSEAIDELWGCLCHQGTVYQASALAVPFLFDAAKAPGLPRTERNLLLALVVHIGLGEDTTWEGYTPWAVVQDCAQAVRGLMPELVGWARDGSLEARTWTLVAAAQHPDAWASLGVDASELMADTDPAVADLVRHAVSGSIPEQSVLDDVLSDADLRDYFEEVVSGLPPHQWARRLVVELAVAERL